MIWKKLVIIKKGSEIYIREMVNLVSPVSNYYETDETKKRLTQ